MRKDFREKLNKELIIWDGGTGSLLQSRGLAAGELPETWNVRRKEDVIWLHQGYFEAGCDVVNTNTFGANRLHYPDNLEEIIESAVDAAKEARKRSGREDAYISLDIGPTGKLLKPLGDLVFEDVVYIFAEVVRIGVKCGVDLILIETMNDAYELKAAILAAKENSDLPVCATVTFDEGGKLLTGGDVRTVVAIMEGLGVDALGTNCSLGPKEIMPRVKELVSEASIPVIVTPNAGLPEKVDGETRYSIGAEEFASLMKEIVGMGVQVIGGCCGTTHEHLRLVSEVSRGLEFRPQEPKNHAYVTSFAQAVRIGGSPVIIGERINPTGKKKLQAALRNNDFAYVLEEGIKQEDNGAHILDVNVGLPDIDEVAMMERTVKELQAVTALPLQIDTANPAALEKGLRIYNGKAMVNSVTGKKESMDLVFPLVKKYGGTVVALPLDEDGIPETAEGRFAVAKKIYDEAAKYGIAPKDIVVDGLTLTVSSGADNGRVALDTLRMVRDRLGGSTILGVSNVSFGLPYRELINSTFFGMALAEGLSCAIINPGSEAMMNTYYASKALLGFDDQCAEYIDAFADYTPKALPTKAAAQASQDSQVNGAPTSQDSQVNARPGTQALESSVPASELSSHIERGLVERAQEAAGAMLETKDPMEIINDELIPALDKVGQGFESGKVFLPQLLMSAEAAKAAFGVIRDSMGGEAREEKGKIVVATVKGDIHDIGKNIAKVLLENYGYQVIDLGKDVEPAAIVDAARNHSVNLVGLSALMTTTVGSMEETIKLLKKEAPDIKVLVGGAVLTPEYASAIGADHYAKDAMSAVRFADSIMD